MTLSKTQKYIISIAMGFICFTLSYAPIPIDTAYDLYFLPALILPAAAAMFLGMRYAVVSCTLGLAMFCPFVVNPTNGWGNLVTSLFLLLWAAGLGWCRDMLHRRHFPFFTPYIFQTLFIIVYFLCNKGFIQFAARFNPPFWYKSYAFTFLPANLINAGATVLAETLTICVLLMNSILSLPHIKKLVGIKTNGYENNNYLVLTITGILAAVFATFSSNGLNNGMMSISFSINAYQSNIGTMQFALLKAAAVLLLGDILIHFLEYHNEHLQKRKEMAETQKAIFESSDDMIWCVNGVNRTIITANSVARAFFDKKSGKSDVLQFDEIFDEEDVVLWNDYFDETVKSGHHTAEYYDSMARRYYQILLHRIDLRAKIYNIAVFAKDITDEILLEDQTKRMNEELEIKVLERTKEMRNAYNEMENMCYVIAHEFKSPIRAISLYNEIITDENRSCSLNEIRDASKKIAVYCNKTLDMISEILENSKVKTSKLNLVRVNMNKLVEDAVEELRLIYNTHDIHIHIEKLPNVMADEILLRCCIYNILSNSVKYSSKNDFTDIHVLYKDEKDENIFYFRDNGIGFDMEYAENLFQMFSRMHLDTDFQGNGIGLVTVKNIIEKHGGKINVDAKINEGCTICFTIPK